MLLRVENLVTQFERTSPPVRIVDGVSLAVARGRTTALVGESGCGKSLTALSILHLLPPGARIAGGRVLLDGDDLTARDEDFLRGVRGRRVAMIFQEPMSSLNPLLTIEQQIAEPLELHLGLRRRAARRRVTELLSRVGIPDPARRQREYPHQMSGGMRQRVMIAMALACEPELLIADEPTTALDVTVEAQILALLRTLQRDSGTGMLFITHDLGVVRHLADTVYVMYAGRIAEHGPTPRVLHTPHHPYTAGLVRCSPALSPGGQAARDTAPAAAGRARLPVIAGDVPDPIRRPSGCPFHPRCGRRGDDPRCMHDEPTFDFVGPEHAAACWHAGEAVPAARG